MKKTLNLVHIPLMMYFYLCRGKKDNMMFTIFYELLFAFVCETYYNGRSRVIYPSNDIGEVYRDLAQKVFFQHLMC